MIKFKKSDELIERVKETLSSYQAAGMIDEGMFYRWIKEILAKLNIPAYTPVHRIQDIEGGEMDIPDDLYNIWTIWRYNEWSEVPSPQQIRNDVIRERVGEYHCTDTCNDPCDVCEFEQKFDTLVIKHYVDYTRLYERCYKKGELLKLRNYKVDRCDKQSPSIHNNSSLEVTMDNNKFYFTFEKGSIYIQYFKMLEDENGLPMIPDVVQIEQAIEDYIIYKIFQKLYYNGEGDFQHLKRESEVAYRASYATALSWVKLPTAAKMVEYINLLRNRYKVFQL